MRRVQRPTRLLVALPSLLLLLTPLVAQVHADDDEVPAPPDEPPEPDDAPKVTWKIVVTVDGTSSVTHTGDSGYLQSEEFTWKGAATVLADVDQEAVAGPSYDVAATVQPINYKVVQAGGAMTYHSVLRGNGLLADEVKIAGPIDPQKLEIAYKYTDGLKTNELAVGVGYVEQGTHFVYQQGTSAVKAPFVQGFVARIGDGKSVFASPTARFTHKGKQIEIDWSYDHSDKRANLDAKMHLSVHAVLTPDDARYVAVIRPASYPDYATWIPKGPKLPDGKDDKGAATLDLMLEVHDKQSGKPAIVAYDAVWRIDGSRLPGVCMNFPRKAEANDKWDLFWEPKQNHGRKVDDDGETLTMKGLKGDALATISSRDYGAHGRVEVQLTLDDGTLLDAYFEDEHGQVSADRGLLVPKDDDLNHIADQWEIDQGIDKAKRDGRWDEEDDPAGLYAKGDGFTVFEEYRGFYLVDPKQTAAWAASDDDRKLPPKKGVYTRLSPTKCELLFDVSGTHLQAMTRGALGYGAAADTKVVQVLSKDQLDPLPNDPDGGHPRGAAFNRVASGPDSEDFGDQQQAIVWIRTDAPVVGTPEAQTAATDPLADQTVGKYNGHKVRIPVYMAPSFTKAVAIVPGSIATDIAGWIDLLGKPNEGFTAALEKLAKAGIAIDAKAEARRLQDPKEQVKLLNREIAFTVMHELGHATGAQHHEMWQYMQEAGDDKEAAHESSGAANCPMRYWHYDVDQSAKILFVVGKWDPSRAAMDGSAWTFCDENRPQMRLHETQDQVYDPGAHADAKGASDMQ